MSFWNWLTRTRTDRGWPAYIINGRIRTSTAALILAFFAITWVHNAYQPPATTPVAPETAQVVPPGFMPDPEYTWVPRTNVQELPRSTTPTTTTTTTTTEPSPTDTATLTSPTSPTDPTATTVVDPDGSGPLAPTTVTSTLGPTTPLPVPNRSGTPTTVPATPGVPGLTSTTTTP
jgi:hypothetical protein